MTLTEQWIRAKDVRTGDWCFARFIAEPTPVEVRTPSASPTPGWIRLHHPPMARMGTIEGGWPDYTDHHPDQPIRVIRDA